MFRGFEPGAFKKVKLSMKFLFCLCRFVPVYFRMVVQNNTTKLHKTIQYFKSNTNNSINVTVLLARSGPPLSIRLQHTILLGGHFPPTINDDFCLAFDINPSSMIALILWNLHHIYLHLYPIFSMSFAISKTRYKNT